jgi:DNA-binding transcriptional LysR family regulator
LLDRNSRRVRLTVAGEQLLERGRELLAHADAVVGDVQAVEQSPSGLLRAGLSPAARFGLAPELLERWSTAAPGVMLHTREDTTGALLRDVRDGRLDLALVFCPPAVDGLASAVLRDEPAVVHVRDDHPLASQEHLALDELAGETLLVAGGEDSPGYTAAVLSACRAAGFEPRTRPDPYPDLGTQAVREGLGVVLYVRSAFGPPLEGSTLVPVKPAVALPFVLTWREDARRAALHALLAAV